MKSYLISFALLLVCASCGTPRQPAANALSAVEAASRATQLLSHGKQDEAETVLGAEVRRHPNNQQLLFTRACCTRSRFSVAESTPLLPAVFNLDPTSPEGQCAEFVLALDEGDEVEHHFESLRALIE